MGCKRRPEREISVGWHEIRAKKNSHNMPLFLPKTPHTHTHITMYVKIFKEIVRLQFYSWSMHLNNKAYLVKETPVK